jgi:signal transduction histidine kinase
VLFNIILNAIQAMEEGGTLSIVTEAGEKGGRKSVRIIVSDTGRGIPPEELDKIFVPFFTTKTQGTGLGLPICKQLLEQHGGTITVESRVGRGTTFTIDLPVVTGQNLNGKEAESA